MMGARGARWAALRHLGRSSGSPDASLSPLLPLPPQAGYHRFTALWLGFKDGQHPQEKETILKSFCGDKDKGKGGVGRG